MNAKGRSLVDRPFACRSRGAREGHPYLQDMPNKRLALVPPAPKTVLERFAEMADEEYARAEALAVRVSELESDAEPRLAEILDLKVQLREVRAQYLLLRAACRNVLAAHESGDEALLDEALARMEEITGGEASTSESLRGGASGDTRSA